MESKEGKHTQPYPASGEAVIQGSDLTLHQGSPLKKLKWNIKKINK